MADSSAFTRVSAELETRSELNTLEARGTLRIALKQAGLDPSAATPDQLAVVLERVLPSELDSRGIENAAAVCSAIGARFSEIPVDAATRETPESVFERLGG